MFVFELLEEKDKPQSG